jgi:hypothetical protein
MTAFTDLAGIGSGIIMNIVKMMAIVAFSVALYFITRWVQKGSKKNKSFKINAEIIDLNGSIEFDKLGLVRSEKTALLEMQFKKRKADSMPPIPKHLIRGGHVVLLNYAPGHYAVIDTYKTIRNIESGKGGVVVVSLGMKKYLMSKQREVINRGEEKKKKFALYAPWYTLGGAIIAVLLFAAFLLYFGVKLDAANIAARITECRSVMGR